MKIESNIEKKDQKQLRFQETILPFVFSELNVVLHEKSFLCFLARKKKKKQNT